MIVKTGRKTVEKKRFIKELGRPAQACQGGKAVTIETQPEGAPDLALGGLVFPRIGTQFFRQCLTEDRLRALRRSQVAQEDDPFVAPGQLTEAGDLRDLKIWVFWKLQEQIFDGRQDKCSVRIIAGQRPSSGKGQTVRWLSGEHLFEQL